MRDGGKTNSSIEGGDGGVEGGNKARERIHSACKESEKIGGRV